MKQELLEEYKIWHKSVWPEMRDALSKHGWQNYSLFIRGDGLLFGYFEAAESFQASLDGMSREDVNRRWQKIMAPYFELREDARPDESLLELKEIFHLD